ncbi:Wzz/FepE/Etk N-terminal domain-containing protein [Streptomyces sp. NPDC005908]|uniref:Wzz/FepE/Etk N-terminal domain-containing protein n=1 Tax=Streptomyces sp. NPDC005908 TaxID=3157084 RepID=UPI0033CE3A70
MTTSTPAEPTAAAPLLDLQALVVSVRRRRRLWGSLALLGLLLGAAVAVLLPPPPTAVTKVLVAHQDDQPNDPGTLILTDVALLHTTRIADAALESLGSSESAEDFMEDYEGAGLTNNLMEIKATGDTGEEAVARAEAVAEAFVADHVRRIKQAAAADATTLLIQRDRMQTELDQVNETIGDGPPEGSPEQSANLESLFARRAELSSRISDFTQRAAEARVGTPRLIAGTQIVDAPHTVRHSMPKSLVTDGGIGLVLGLVLGLVVAAVASVVGDRPVLRREIAAHLGASVTAEVSRSALRPGGLWRGRRRRAARTRLTSSLARTVRGSTEPVSLLELGCARGASAIALDLARTLAEDEPVVVVDALPRHGPAARRRPKPGDPEVVGVERAAAVSPERRRIGVGSVAPGATWADLASLGTRTVLVVRAGHGTTAWLHTVARQLADRRVEVAGVVLVDPDPRDRTDGTLWDGPFPVQRARGERPARQNGGTSSTVQAVGDGTRRTERLPMWAARVPDSDQEAR